ncbi:MAG TPA: hypothetical protein VHA10_16840 [Hypericibacter adhaerens]|uniref:Uncharacterized protein n=1 Tax=Hypericibacter adhaerens TaxID=2602016 RepID=A0A5J6MWB9_9PROT|nr:hypothetical protein [Hypericibacter adhaerens]QEX21407.1 hypothetical protein FRZ61_13320 [Hypericibacter adhaerens]HWA44887.1 hypothetical protein [Hypericibacter adhaerens]
MKRAFGLLFVLLLAMGVAGIVHAATQVDSDSSKAKLMGPLWLSLQWIGNGSFEQMGKARVEDRDGTLHLTGRQEGRGDSAGDWLALEGDILAVGLRTFHFKGWIETRVSYINEGKPCRRDVEADFLMKPGKKYWRLQAIDNPCDVAADYVDLFAR